MSRRRNQNSPPDLLPIVELFNAGELATALEKARLLEQKYPKSATLLNIIGTILTAQFHFEDALEVLNSAKALDPDNAAIEASFGSAYLHMGQPAKAFSAYQKATERDPANADYHFNLAITLEDINQSENAISSYTNALRLNPDAADAVSNLASLYASLGRTDKAKNLYTKAIRKNPSNGDLHLASAEITRYKKGDKHLSEMIALLNASSTNENDRIALGFAVFKALSDIDERDASFAALKRANDAYFLQQPYSADSDRMLFSEIRRTFPSYRAAAPPPFALRKATAKPLFIVGLPRSGTTLVEQIIASHSDVFGAGELGALQEAVNPRMDSRPSGPFEALTNSLTCRNPVELRGTYMESLRQLQISHPVVTDKMPMNFRWLGFALSAIPEAKVIHVSRDPVASCWSMYQRRFLDSNLLFANNLVTLGQYYHLYRDIMRFWKSQLPGRILDVSYENLTEDQEGVSRKILAHSGLDWQDRVMDFHKNDRIVRTASKTQIRKKMYRDSSKAWRAYENHLGPLLDALRDGG